MYALGSTGYGHTADYIYIDEALKSRWQPFCALMKEIETAASAEPKNQGFVEFDKRFMTEYVIVAMLSHSLCEAAINTILALGLAGSEAEFSLIERHDIKEKWRTGPLKFAATWEFPCGTALDETLAKLVKQRNTWTHYKTSVSQGNLAKLSVREVHEKESRWIHRFFSLPYDLAKYSWPRLIHTSPPAIVLLGSAPIQPAREHLNAMK